MKRVPVHEWLDSDSGSPQEVDASLADLRGINRRFGGVTTTQSMIEEVARSTNSHSLSILEVGAGSGDVPQIVEQRLRQQGIRLEVTLSDRVASHLPRCNGSDHSNAVAADALALPFADASFDLVHCGLFVHHLAPEEAIQFAQEGLRVCRTALLINDLIRGPLHLLLVYAGTPLFRSLLTRHDAPASVRQAYTPEEMEALLTRANAAAIQIQRHFLFRMGVIAWKKPPTISS